MTSRALVSETDAVCLQVVVTTCVRRNLGYKVDSRFDGNRTDRQSNGEHKNTFLFYKFCSSLSS